MPVEDRPPTTRFKNPRGVQLGCTRPRQADHCFSGDGPASKNDARWCEARLGVPGFEDLLDRDAGRAVEHYAYGALFGVIEQKDHAALEVRVSELRRCDQQPTGERSSVSATERNIALHL